MLLSLDMIFTDEVGKRMDVIYCAAWSFQLPLWFLLEFEVLSCTVAIVCAFFNPFRKILMVAASLLILHLLASHLNL